MTIYLMTPLPKLAADFMDVVRVFVGQADCQLVDEPSADTLVHYFEETGGQWRCAFSWQGKEARREAAVPTDPDPWRQQLLFREKHKFRGWP